MPRILLALTLCAGLACVAVAEPPKDPDKPGGPPPGPVPQVIVVPAKSTPPSRPLKYTLLPAQDDLKPGNAASLWRQAYLAAREAKLTFTNEQYKWLGPGPEGTDLKDLPLKEIREHLDRAKIVLRLADEAARKTTCDWEYPVLTIQSVAEAVQLGEVQMAREMASLLSLRFRLQLAEKKYDDALATIQTGLQLGRHIAQGDMLIQNLVGLAITSIMLGRVEEFMQQPDAPNLSWALAALPRPYIDVRRPVEAELGTFLRSFPQLREADRRGMTREQAQKLADDVFGTLAKYCNPDSPELQGKLGAALAVPMYLERAKKELVARGRNKDDVEAMSAPQAVLVWLHEEYARERDELLKWFLLPAWQALPGLEEVDRNEKEARKKVGATMVLEGGWVLRLLVPAILKVYEANLRTERHLATLRAVEAIRLYAAVHDGKLPAALKDVNEVPLPQDPRTGKGFDEFYKVDGGTAVLEIPMQPNILIRRYEFATPN